jgi:hypothetical protein
MGRTVITLAVDDWTLEQLLGVLLFGASQDSDGWLIRTAQNTNIMPEALTAPADKSRS